MNEEWQKKILGLVLDNAAESVSAEASVANHTLVNVEALGDAPVLADLSLLAVVDITGEDAQKFLQAQVCNDLTSLANGEMQINGYCNPKGRLLALFTVWAQADGYRIVLPQDIVPSLTKRLQMFIMRDKVTIAVRDDLVCSGIVVEASASDSTFAELASSQASMPAAPTAPWQFTETDTMQLTRWSDSESTEPAQSMRARYLCIAEPEVMFTLWENAVFTKVGWSYWRWLDINAGLPSVFNVSVEQFIPQMLNMQHINALSFKKGCYPGQEIVARMHYLGKLKKHTKHLRLPNGTQVPAPGDVLATDSNNNAGQVVDAVADELGINLLAVVNIETPANEIKLFDKPLQVASLPYSVEVEAKEEL